MSMTLILWKSPVVREPEEAEALLAPFYEGEDDSAFEASLDIARVADELRRLHPWRDLTNEETLAGMSEEERSRWRPEALEEMRGVEGGEPFATLPFGQTDRLLVIDIKWGADNKVLDDIVALARKHELVLYDPQGPSVHLPDDPTEAPAEPAPTWGDHARIWAMVLFFAGLTCAAWLIPIGCIRWPLVAIGAFLTSAALMVVHASWTGGSDESA